MRKYRNLLLIFFVLSIIACPISLIVGYILSNGWLIGSSILWIFPDIAFICILVPSSLEIKRIERLRKEFISRLILFRKN